MKKLQEIIKILEELRKDYKIKSVKFFGSYTERTQTETSM